MSTLAKDGDPDTSGLDPAKFRRFTLDFEAKRNQELNGRSAGDRLSAFPQNPISYDLLINDRTFAASIPGQFDADTSCNGDVHSPIPCFYRADDPDQCVTRALNAEHTKLAQAAEALGSSTELPLAFALWQAGCDRMEANRIAGTSAADLHCAPDVLNALKRSRKSMSVLGTREEGTCRQCERGSNTYAYFGPYPEGSECVFVAKKGTLAINRITKPTDVLCLGANGKLKWCRPGEYMAVSHVWGHKWQGYREDGFCSRSLEMLLDVAKTLGLSWVWIDVAMITKKEPERTLAINSMRNIYSNAGATLVCDRLLLNLRSDLARVIAIALDASDWMKRVWTLQEALLSRNLQILTRMGVFAVHDLVGQLILHSDDQGGISAVQAAKVLSPLIRNQKWTTESIVDRLVGTGLRRTTSKSVDLVRALFPLFDLQWPAADTTMESGQVMLLEAIERETNVSSRLLGFFGPLGLPSPWTWAPLQLVGCSSAPYAVATKIETPVMRGNWQICEVEKIVADAAPAGLLCASDPVGYLRLGFILAVGRRTTLVFQNDRDLVQQITDGIELLTNSETPSNPDAPRVSSKEAKKLLRFINNVFATPSAWHLKTINDKFEWLTSLAAIRWLLENILPPLCTTWGITSDISNKIDLVADLYRACVITLEAEFPTSGLQHYEEIAGLTGSRYNTVHLTIKENQRQADGHLYHKAHSNFPWDDKLLALAVPHSDAIGDAPAIDCRLVEIVSTSNQSPGYLMRVLGAFQVEAAPMKSKWRIVSGRIE